MGELWEALLGVSGLGLLAALVGIGVGIVLGIWRKQWKVLVYCLAAFIVATAVFIVAGLMMDENPVEPSAPAQETQAIPSATCPTSAEKAYLLRVTSNIAELRGTLPEFGRLTKLAGENPSLFLDDDWKAQISVLLVTMELVAEGLVETTSPGSAAWIHRDSMAMGQTIRDFVQLYTRGVDDLDGGSLEAAGVKLASLGGMDETVSERIRRFCE